MLSGSLQGLDRTSGRVLITDRILPSLYECIMILNMPSFDQLTIRSISSALRTALDREAARRGQSLNRTVLALLAERLGLADATAPVEYDDLDELALALGRSPRPLASKMHSAPSARSMPDSGDESSDSRHLGVLILQAGPP